MVKELIYDEALLGERCEEIDAKAESKLVSEICVNMKDTMREKNILSLSANQIGYNKRIIVINYNGDFKTYLNPVIAHRDGFKLSEETNASIPDKKFILPRYTNIDIAYQTQLGAPKAKQVLGMTAIIFQQQIDLLDGMLLSDIGLEIDEDYDNASEEDKQEILSAYFDFLEKQKEAIKNEIEQDELLKSTSDAIKFMDSVQSGETKLEYDEKIVEYLREQNKENVNGTV